MVDRERDPMHTKDHHNGDLPIEFEGQPEGDHLLDADVTRGLYEVDLIRGDIIYQGHKVTTTRT